MEELQDAIEDAQYINAMQDDTPRPTREWKFPPPETVEAYVNNLSATRPIYVRPEGVCSGSLGLFMFTKYVKEQGDALMSSFIVDVATYRQSKSSANRAVAAQKIFADYLMDNSSGNPYFMESRRSDIIRSYPGMRVKKHMPVVPQHSFSYPSQPLSSSPDAAVGVSSTAVAGAADNNTSNPIHSSHSNLSSGSSIGGGGDGGGGVDSGHIAMEVVSVGIEGGSGASSNGVASPTPSRAQPAAGATSNTAAATTAANTSANSSNNTQQSKRSSSHNHPASGGSSRVSRRSSQANKSSLVAFGALDNELMDIDLELPLQINSSVSNPSLSMDVLATKLAEDWKEYIVGVESAAPNAVRLKGEPLNKAKAFFAQLNNNASLLATVPTSDNTNSNTSSSSVSSSSMSMSMSASMSISGNRSSVSGHPQSFNQQLLSVFDEIENIIFYCLVDRHWVNFRASPHWTKYWQFMSLLERPIADSDFAMFRVLGRGGFGMVNGCKHCYSGKLFAMKVMNKKRVKLKKAEALCLNERNILAVVDSPYVVCLKYAFHSPIELNLVLDLMIGGDLGYHLSARSKQGGFTVAEAKYFAARILMGIGALHDLNIVYRDLKPENVLMDENGQTKLSDLGLACKVGRSGLSGTCGTRGYWAPEMLRRNSEGKRERYFLSVDWFSFGCCIYEFIRGVGPFRTERARNWGDFPKVEKADRDKAIDLAIQEMEPDFTSAFDDVVRDLITKLLNKNGKERLGARGGYEAVMQHPWFADIDFDNLNTMTPPIKPNKDINMASQSDIGSFADERDSRKQVLTEEDQKMYEHWQFISPRSFQEEVVGYLLYEEINGPIKTVDAGHVCCCCIV